MSEPRFTAQEIMDDCGFIVWVGVKGDLPKKLPCVMEEPYDDGIVPQGARVVLVATLSRGVAYSWAQRYGLAAERFPNEAAAFYKAVAE